MVTKTGAQPEAKDAAVLPSHGQYAVGAQRPGDTGHARPLDVGVLQLHAAGHLDIPVLAGVSAIMVLIQRHTDTRANLRGKEVFAPDIHTGQRTGVFLDFQERFHHQVHARQDVQVEPHAQVGGKTGRGPVLRVQVHGKAHAGHGIEFYQAVGVVAVYVRRHIKQVRCSHAHNGERNHGVGIVVLETAHSHGYAHAMVLAKPLVKTQVHIGPEGVVVCKLMVEALGEHHRHVSPKAAFMERLVHGTIAGLHLVLGEVAVLHHGFHFGRVGQYLEGCICPNRHSCGVRLGMQHRPCQQQCAQKHIC